ncbi:MULTISPECIES: DUF11 domain-containing protein [unclassified Leifsonia]|uniref:DUF11 domain-containing protein n=1 Tax=unclassified Leifsonia TaxID=2663824 RepID=UPI001E301E74|nr:MULTISPECIES: DUF11 domain-containing protein [unclassified Leifsonia]
MTVGALVGVLLLPQHYSDAATTAVSTVFTTGKNAANGSTAASDDAPGGPSTGTARPGDVIDWVVESQNNTSANAVVDLKDDISTAGTYVPGSLRLPPNQNPAGSVTPQYRAGGPGWVTGTPPADATGIGFVATPVPQGTQQLSPPFVVPPSKVIAMGGGDAYNVVARKDLLYAIYHHAKGAVVFCAQHDGTTCPGWPTGSNVQTWSSVPGTPIGTGTSFAGITPQQGGTWLAGDRLYWYAGLTDGSSNGIACLDLSTKTPSSCGYTARSGAAVSNTAFAAQMNGTGLPSDDGNTYSVVVSRNQAALVCTTPDMGSCPGVTLIASGVTTTSIYTSSSYGPYVFASIQQTSTSAWKNYCYNTNTKALCTGSWPVNGSAANTKAGSPMAPILSRTGAVSGVCTITNGPGTASNCVTVAGAAAANPYAGTGANYAAGGNGAGEAYVIGTRVYLSNGNQVMCRDFGQWSGTGTVPPCAGFSNVNNGLNYTIRPATDVATNCLVATGDAAQFVLFDATTGKECAGPTEPREVTVTPSGYYCGTGATSFRGWRALTLPGLTDGSYANATVSLRDQNDAVISGFEAVTVNPGASVDLSGIPTTVTSITATVTVNAVTDPAGVESAQVGITWSGDAPQLCFQTTAPPVSCDAPTPLILTNTANAVTTSPAGTDAPNGNTSGGARFTVEANPASCSLAITKDSSVQSARPGDTVTYTVTVKNTGTQAYDTASLTDDLTDVLKDASYTGEARASQGAVAYTAPTLAWSGPLAPGDTATITYSVTVKNPTPGDHSLRNTVVSPTVGSNCAAGSADAKCTSTVPVSDLTVTKVADDSAVTKPAKVGDTITYRFSAKNTGQTTLTGVTISDPHVGLSPLTYSWPGTAGALQVDETVTATATYQLTQADIDNGLVPNTATASGNPPTGPSVSTPPAAADVPLTQGPDLTFTKDAVSSGVSSPAKVGDVITYVLKAKNTGNTTLTGVTITDPKPGLSNLVYTWPGVAGVLQPSQEVVAQAQYVLTQADLNVGIVSNTATSSGNPPTGPPVTPPPSTTDTPLTQGPGLSLTKGVNNSQVKIPAAVGDVITYTFVTENTGNVTLTGVSITDQLPGLSAIRYTWPGTPGTLTPGQTVTATATYQLTQADINTGQVINQATATGTPPTGQNVTTPPATVPVPLTAGPKLTSTKTADPLPVGTASTVGDTVTYRFTAKNEGNVTLTGVTITDTLPGLSALTYTWPGTPGTLLPGETVTAMATYTLTQADIDTGHVVNTATTRGTPPAGPDVTPPPSVTDTPLVANPDMTLVKTADRDRLNSPSRVGDQITYRFTAHNSGNVTLTNVDIVDPLPGLSPLTYSWPGTPGTLLPDQKVTATAVYTLTQADLNTGHVANAATTAGTPPTGPAVVPPPALNDVPLTTGPGLDLTKVTLTDGLSRPAKVGDLVTFHFAAQNIGNVTLTDVTIDDPLPGLSALTYSWPGSPGTLTPGQKVTATATYQLTQADIDAGTVVNTATTIGRPPVGTPVTDEGTATVDLPPAPSIDLTKLADPSTVQTPPQAGDTVTYAFVAENTGNVTLTGVSITDPLPGLSALTYTWPGTPGTLAPKEKVTATATYQLTQADIDAGHVANTAGTEGTPPTGTKVTDGASADLPLVTVPSIDLVKAADLAAVQSPPRAGDTVTYTFEAENTGNVTLTGVTISDPKPGLSALTYTWPGTPGTLAPKQKVTATATYQLTQADIDSGHLANTAGTEGTPPTGTKVTDQASVDIPLTTKPGIRLVKKADTALVQSPAESGDTVTFTFASQNIGNVTLTNVVIQDPLPGLSSLTYTWPGSPGVLAPGETVTATATYRLTQADLDAEELVNTATTTGTPPSGDDVTDVATVTIPLPADPALTVAKSAGTIGIQTPAGAGTTITYTFTVTNTGNVTMTRVSVADPMVGLSPLTYAWPGAPGTLAPRETVIATATYVLTQADIDAGHVANTARATGTPPSGVVVTPPPASTDTPLAPSPSIELVKTADTVAVHSPARPGDVITYTFRSKNDGNVTLTGVTITDPLAGLSELAYSWPGAPGVLAPDESVTATATYLLTQADIDSGHIANTASTAGTPPSGVAVTDEASAEVPLAADPRLTLIKTADAGRVQSPAMVGDTVTYRFVVSNTGNVTIDGVSVADPLAGLSSLTYAWPGVAGRLEPGQSVTATADYRLTNADLAAGHVQNTAVAVGTPPSGERTTTPPASVDTPLSRQSLPAVSG